MCFIKGNLCPNNLVRVPSAHTVSWLKKRNRCPSSGRRRPMPETCILCWKSWISCQCWELNTGHWNLKQCHVHIHTACMHALSLQSCPTPCDPMDCSPPGSSDHRILQAGILEVGSHALLQKIFLIHGLNLHLLYHRQIIYPLSHLGSPIQVLDVNKSKKTWSLLLSGKH